MTDRKEMSDTARAEHKLQKLRAELADLRREYREAEAEGARPRELEMLAERGRELAARIERGRQWIDEKEGVAA